jgi:hypothetical protein
VPSDLNEPIADLARLGVDSALMARPTQIHQF